MEAHQKGMAITVRVLAYLIKKGVVDPDKQIELYYASAPFKQNACVDSKSTSLQKSIENHKFDYGVCDMSTALDAIATQIIPSQAAPNPKPVSLYILTNGRWNGKLPDDLCKVDEAIEKILNALSPYPHLQKNWLGIQFIRFYESRSEEDVTGKRRLKFFDEKLGTYFKTTNLGDWSATAFSLLVPF
jgi:hypothetical protein